MFEQLRKRWRVGFVAGVLALGTVGQVTAAAGQEGQGDVFGGTGSSREPVGTAKPLPRVERVSVDGRRVQLTVLLARAQRALPDRAFHLLVEEEERQASVERRPADALEVVVVIDPMAGRAMPSVQGAVAELVRSLPNGSRVGIVSGGRRPEVVTPPVADDGQALPAVSEVQRDDNRDPYAAADLALDQFSSRRSHGRFLVFVSAGGYPVDERVADLGERFGAAGVDTYVLQLDRAFLGVATPRWPFPMGSGRILVAGANTKLTSLTDQIAAEILSQRIVSFALEPDETDIAPVVRIDDPSGSVDVQALVTTPESRGSSDYGLPDERPRPTPWKTIGIVALGFVLVVALLLVPPRIRRRRARRAALPEAPLPVVPVSPAPDRAQELGLRRPEPLSP